MKQNERLNSFKTIVLGEYILKQLKDKEENGSMYLQDITNWESIKNKNIYFNISDKNQRNPFTILRQLIVENFLKKNFIIIRLEAPNSSLSFYCNNLPNVFDQEFFIIKLLINPFDFISSEGSPIYNETYTLSYILNDPSKEFDIVKTPTTTIPSSTSHIFSLDTPMTLPKSTTTNIKTPNISEELKSKIKTHISSMSQETIGLIVFILFLILLFTTKYL